MSTLPAIDPATGRAADLLAAVQSRFGVIACLPPPGRTVTVAPGEALCWVFAVPTRASLHLTRRPAAGQDDNRQRS